MLSTEACDPSHYAQPAICNTGNPPTTLIPMTEIPPLGAEFMVETLAYGFGFAILGALIVVTAFAVDKLKKEK